ncbi:MAG TPA: DUF4367 domain-containing protein [Candidatus Bathyarchaeia archaeon]
MKLKWKNIRTLALLATVILGISSTFIYLSAFSPMTNQPETADFRPFYPPALPIPGEEVSFEQAQASVPFKIRLPTKMGTPVQINLLQPPQATTESATMIYADNKPSKGATDSDVMNQNGIILFEEHNRKTLNQSIVNIRARIDSSVQYRKYSIINENGEDGVLQEVDINGYVGCAGGNVYHCVSWYTETTYYQLTSNIKIPVQQLIEIAQSIPIN